MAQGNANMTIKVFLDVASVLPPTTSVLLRGDHGIGKSQLVREVAKTRASSDFDGIERPVIDRRLAQMTEGDMMGLPSTDGEMTRFNPPDWYVKACKEPCVLLLDELNRANTEIMQAAFQIVLDRELAGRTLHPDTIVMAAINTAANYNVNEVDPALLDRFFVVDLIPEVQDWTRWAVRKNPETQRSNIHEVIVNFIRDNSKWLDTPADCEPSAVATSRRSWERLSNTLCDLALIDTPDDGKFFPICLGYVGTEASIAFTKFAKTYDRTISAEDILERYKTKKIQAKLYGKDGDKEPTQDELNSLIEKVSEHVTKKLDEVNKKQGTNLAAFMKTLPDELKLTMWNALTRRGADKQQLAVSVHKYCGEIALSVFGVPIGERGIGVTPKIPGLLQEKK